jgi:hypothetical protein
LLGEMPSCTVKFNKNCAFSFKKAIFNENILKW